MTKVFRGASSGNYRPLPRGRGRGGNYAGRPRLPTKGDDRAEGGEFRGGRGIPSEGATPERGLLSPPNPTSRLFGRRGGFATNDRHPPGNVRYSLSARPFSHSPPPLSPPESTVYQRRISSPERALLSPRGGRSLFFGRVGVRHTNNRGLGGTSDTLSSDHSLSARRPPFWPRRCPAYQR